MLSRLRAAKASLPSPTATWNSTPYQRRAGVLALLYTDPSGRLGCLVSVRSKELSYGGDLALPGGKAETPEEEPWQVCRREAEEEIGLPQSLELEHVLDMPAYLSSRIHCVVPSIAYLPEWTRWDSTHNVPKGVADVLNSEVESVLGVDLESLLSDTNYHTRQTNWNGLRFPQHFFKLLARQKQVGEPGHLTLWGLTANILIDVARLAYGREPEFKHRRPGQIGDQQLVNALIEAKAFENYDKNPNFTKLWGKDSDILRTRSAEV